GPWRSNVTDPDLASCFTEGAFIIPINTLMLVFGSLELHHLLKRSAVIPNHGLRNWHYLIERITLSFLIILSIVVLELTLEDSKWQIMDLFVISAMVNVIAVATSILLALFVFVLELLPKPKTEYELIDDDSKNSPEESANIFSRLTFYWMTPLMKLGHKKYLTLVDLWNLNSEDNSKKISADFESAWKKELSKKNPSLFKALVFTFGGPFAFAAFFKAIQDALNFVQPQLLKQLIIFVKRQSDEEKPSALWGYSIAGEYHEYC
ncbi:7620_t:CDS:2, partial [Scutellospora calospora]